MLELTYNNGRGRVQLNLEMIIPCSAADMKRVLSFVNLSDDPDEHAKTIYDYIAGQVAELKKEREKHDENSAAGKEKITKINATMKKYLANASALVKGYGLPELSDKSAQVVLHSATVYAVESKECKTTIETYSGWTFEKGGFTFDVYKKSKAYYQILLHGTGLSCATARNKTAAPAEVTPRLLDILRKGTKKIETAKENFNALMIAAGYMEPEKTETISNKNNEQEEKTMSDFTFTATTLTCKGKEFPCEYNIIADGSVLAFVILGVKENGRKEKQRIHFNPDHPDHAAALAAAQAAAATGERPANISTGYKKIATPAGNVIEKVQPEQAAAAETIQPEPEQAAAVETIQPEPEQAAAVETIQPEPEQAAGSAKQARGTVPEKTFIGQTIQGNGWKIYFDGETARTRVIFEETPTAAARAAIENAGFYYSSVMNSWNKKLTFKAYRAAQALSGTLSELYAA